MTKRPPRQRAGVTPVERAFFDEVERLDDAKRTPIEQAFFDEVEDTDVYDTLAGPDLDVVAGEFGVFRGDDDDERLRLRLRLRRR